jgi:hypothetical protein
VLRVGVGEEEADSNRGDAGGLQRPGGASDGVVVERSDNLALGIQALSDLEGELQWRERLGTLIGQVGQAAVAEAALHLGDAAQSFGQ